MSDKKNEYMTLDEFRISRASRYGTSQGSILESIMSAWRKLTNWIRRYDRSDK